jgi:hypothetical protein
MISAKPARHEKLDQLFLPFVIIFAGFDTGWLGDVALNFFSI